MELFFMMAELFLTLSAAYTAVSVGGKSFGVRLIGYLPAEKQSKGQGKHDQGEHVGNKHKRREHHGEIPIVYAAIGTATVLHKPCLEGTKEQNAYHIADAVSQADQHQSALVYDSQQVKPTDSAVQGYPHGSNYKRPLPWHKSGLFPVRWQEIPLEHLLTARAFKP